MILIVVFIGLAIGVVMGLTGAGGGVLAVPALVAAMGWTIKQAAPVAMVAVASGALLGTVEGLRRGLVRYRAATLMAAVGIPFTTIGQQLAQRLPEAWLKALFALVLVIVAIRLIRLSLMPHSEESQAELNMNKAMQLNPLTQRFIWTPGSAAIMAGIGAVTGFTAGLLGVGGGFILVPMLLRLTPLRMHSCIATSLMVMALVSLGAITSAALTGLHLPMEVTLVFAVTSMLGMLGGRYFAHRLPAQMVQRGFAALLLMVALLLIAKLY